MRVIFVLLTVICLASLLAWGSVRTISDIQFDRQCGGHLKRAADANTVELATQEMETVVSYLERNGMIGGYTTAILWTVPSEDVGYWYSNLKSSLGELKAVKPDADQMTKSNVLMKLRETLMDEAVITEPTGIEIFPNNVAYAWWSLISLIALIVCVLGAMKTWDD